jgi:hypothetical protein
VQVDVVVHAGFNVPLYVGKLTYRITQPQRNILPIVLGSIAGLIVLIGISVLIGTLITLLIVRSVH